MADIIVGGSIAYDNIMEFPGLFGDQILPDKLQALSISFLVNSLKRQKGGTAPNIAYSLALLKQNPAVLGTAGKDFGEYKLWLEENAVDTSFINIMQDDYTATCFITTDRSSNQITGFYPGAMTKDSAISLKNLVLGRIKLFIIAPTEPEAMMNWVRECKELKIPYMFDAGMQIPRLTGTELSEGIMGSEIAIFNEYEYEMMLDKTGLSRETILDNTRLLVETRGAEGSVLATRAETVQVPAVKPHRIADPTGAGDAYRAGLVKGYFENKSLEVMGSYGSVSAVYALEHTGATEHSYTVDEFLKRYNENFDGRNTRKKV
jgi:adenosine kinase